MFDEMVKQLKQHCNVPDDTQIIAVSDDRTGRSIVLINYGVVIFRVMVIGWGEVQYEQEVHGIIAGKRLFAETILTYC